MRNDKPGKVLWGSKRPFDAHRERAGIGLQAAGRRLDILAAQGAFDVADGEVAGCERTPVDPDSQGVVARPANPHARHTVQRRKPVDQESVCIVGELRRGEVFARQVQPYDDIIIGIGLFDFGRIRFGRQLIQDA